MKRFLINNALGTTAIAVRNKYRILSAALSNPESLSVIANRQLADTLIVKLCSPGKTFVDVGAHIGLFVSMVKNYDSSIEIVGIEAMPDKIAALRRRFPDVTFHECAAGNSNCEAIFSIYPERDGFSSLVGYLDNPGEKVKQITVNVRTLDSILENDNIDAMKLIIEGSELDAIKGSQNILERHRPVIMFESSFFEDPDNGNTIAARWQIFQGFDYTLYIPNRVAHEGPGLSLEAFIDSHIYPTRTFYYFAIPNDRHDEIMHKARRIQGITT